MKDAILNTYTYWSELVTWSLKKY